MRRTHRLSTSVMTRRRSADRAGEMEAKTIIILIFAAIGGLGLLGCVGVVVFVYAALPRMQAAMQQAQAAAQTSRSQINLKQIGLAMHNYHDVITSFPPGGIFAEDGTPHHSWQTMLLPYVNHVPLYNAIDFNRRWTDAENLARFNTQIPEYLHPMEPQTTVISGAAASHYAANSHIFFENSQVRIADITDGTSNTMMGGEVAAEYKAWGDPTNTRDPSAGIGRDAAMFGRPGDPGGCTILLMDGSVRDISSSASAEVLKALSTPNGGEPAPVF